MHDKDGVLGGALWCMVGWVCSILNFELGFLNLGGWNGGGAGGVEGWSEHEREVAVRVGLLAMWVVMQSGQVSDEIWGLVVMS